MAQIPSTTYEHELAPVSVGSAMKAAGAKAVMQGAGASYLVPFRNITVLEGFNVRIDTPDYLKHVAAIKASIKAEGFYPDQPVAGYAEKNEADELILALTNGHTRHRALGELIADEAETEFTPDFLVPMIAKASGQSLEDLTFALISGNQGRPLTVVEKAIVAKRLVTMGVEEARIAERMGVTEKYVGDLLILAAASPTVRNFVINEKVSATEAVKQLRKDPKKAAEKLKAAIAEAEAAGKTKVTAKDIDGTVKKPKAPKGDSADEGVSASARMSDGKVYQTFRYGFKQGEIVDAATIKPISRVLDGEWWAYVDDNTKTHVVIEDAITIEIKVTTVSKGDEAEDDDGGIGDTDDGVAGALTDQSGDAEDEADDTFADDATGDGEDGEAEEEDSSI